MIVRPANAAGFLYPSDADELVAEIAERLLALPNVESAPLGLIVPHSSIDMSGHSSAAAFRHLSMLSPVIHQVVIIGATEHDVKGAVLPISEQFRTPLGNVEVDQRSLASLSLLPFVHRNDRTHFQTLSIEVQLPFLQTCLVDFSILPILVGEMSEDDLNTLLFSLPSGSNTLLILSVDVDFEKEQCVKPHEQYLFEQFIAFVNQQNKQVEPTCAGNTSNNRSSGLGCYLKSYIIN